MSWGTRASRMSPAQRCGCTRPVRCCTAPLLLATSSLMSAEPRHPPGANGAMVTFSEIWGPGHLLAITGGVARTDGGTGYLRGMPGAVAHLIGGEGSAGRATTGMGPGPEAYLVPEPRQPLVLVLRGSVLSNVYSCFFCKHLLAAVAVSFSEWQKFPFFSSVSAVS